MNAFIYEKKLEVILQELLNDYNRQVILMEYFEVYVNWRKLYQQIADLIHFCLLTMKFCYHKYGGYTCAKIINLPNLTIACGDILLKF